MFIYEKERIYEKILALNNFPPFILYFDIYYWLLVSIKPPYSLSDSWKIAGH